MSVTEKKRNGERRGRREKVMGEEERGRRVILSHLLRTEIQRFWVPLFQWAQVGRTKSLLVVWAAFALKDRRESGATHWLPVETDLDWDS